MKQMVLNAKQKALAINLDASIYGTIAEIGAGQEVARNFFQAGAASGTIAQSISAYDMQVSDSIYGKTAKRYVCKPRLEQMLDHEYEKVHDTLAHLHPDKRFFAYANTVEAINYSKTNKSHGWLGVRFQATVGGEHNDVIIHVRMLDKENVHQQEALGKFGVNLIYACYHHSDDPHKFLNSLVENISFGRVQIDMVHFEGPVFKNVDNRLLSLFLVKNNMADAVMFGPDGNTIHPTEVLYKKHIMALRGRFRPVTHVHLDMLKNGLEMFEQEENVDPEKIVVITELTLKDLGGKDQIEERDFIDRVDILCSLGQTVLISNFQEYYKLVNYLTRYNTGAQVALILGANSLINIFNEKYYQKLHGGLLESFGQLFHKDVRLYLYPYMFGKELINTENMLIPDKFEFLYKHLLHNKRIRDFKSFNKDILHIFSHKVLDMIKNGEEQWEEMVPPMVARIIRENDLFYISEKKTDKV